MKRGMRLFAALGMAAVLIGCQGEAAKEKVKPAAESTEPAKDASSEGMDGSSSKQSSVTEGTSSEFTLVSLKVPNMT